MDSDGSRASELVVRLAGLQDMRQRGYALAIRLRSQEDEFALEVIKLIRERALAGQDDFRLLYNSLLVPGILEEVLGPKRLTALGEIARTRGELELQAILGDMPSGLKVRRNEQPFLDPALRETPLGTRKSLARKPDFKMIERMARDQDHRVIEHLLDNPRLTERDVIKIGATRPTSPKVLAVIYNHPKWISRYSVKKTIVLNPYAPLSIALRLVALLNLRDLEDVCESQELPSVLQDEARRLLEKRNPFPEIELSVF